VLNDLYREAQGMGVELAGARVTAAGGFDPDSWSSTGITYRVELDSAAPGGDLRSPPRPHGRRLAPASPPARLCRR